MDTKDNNSSAPTCQVCGSINLREVEGFASLPRITSDCRSFPPGGRLVVCIACGGIQKLPDEKWLKEINNIYSGYEPYYQSGGEEQIVFDRVMGKPRRRSEVILERLSASEQLAATGDALDVGCGNGAMLRAISSILKGWSLNGYELGDAALPYLARIPRFETLYTGSLDTLGRSFDLVTMIHSLEHFPDSMSIMSQLHSIVGEGRLFIEVCNVEENPFDILVADHLMHFSPPTLKLLLKRAGFSAVSVGTDWIPKEISLLAKVDSHQRKEVITEDMLGARLGEKMFTRMADYVSWLGNTVVLAKELTLKDRPLGIFGTSIAATWLASQLNDSVSFFVDEDENRIGKKHMGRTIIHPNQIPDGGNVYLALAPQIAKAIAQRLINLPCALVLPPEISN